MPSSRQRLSSATVAPPSEASARPAKALPRGRYNRLLDVELALAYRASSPDSRSGFDQGDAEKIYWIFPKKIEGYHANRGPGRF
jgi:hypothetical protein